MKDAPIHDGSDLDVIKALNTLYTVVERRVCGDYPPWANTFWRGQQVAKSPLDLWVYQEILFGYLSTNVLRHEDWHPSALYMEKYFQAHGLANLNANPETVIVNGVEYDLIRVPRLKGFYRNRIA
jgi:cephalosporin hydroxylase